VKGFFKIGSGAFFDAADVWQVESFILAVVIGGGDTGAFHLVRGRQMLHDFLQACVLMEDECLGNLRTSHTVFVPFGFVRICVDSCPQNQY